MATTTATTTATNRFGAEKGGGPAGGAKKGAAAADAGKGKGEGKKKSLFKSKKFLIILVGVLVVGYGAYSFLMPSKAGPPVAGDVVPVDAMTLNLADGHYLQIAISVELVKGKATATDFSTAKAAQATIDEFSNRTVASVSSLKARKRLTAELLTQLKAAYPGEVFGVDLTKFVTQ